jgi:Na+-translocating ferredoxin:NAD+ oxidoreductase subunit G
MTTAMKTPPPAATAPDGGAGGPAAADAAGSRQAVASWRLIMTLGVAGALAGLLIVSVHQWTQPRILAHQARAIAAAIDEVLQGPARTETLFLWDGALTAAPPAGVDTVQLDRVWAGYDEGGSRIGFAIIGAEAGFQDVIRLMFGYDPGTRRVMGMRILESKETPGLGDKIFKDTVFVGAFRTAQMPLVPTKPGTGTGDPREVDTITGATISARTVINIINNRVERIGPLLDEAGSRP